LGLLQGKITIVTGSNRGIGNNILARFAAEGAEIWAHARRFNEAHEAHTRALSEKFDVSVTPVYFDFEDREEMKGAVKKIRSSGKPIDVLVNNAGVTHNALFEMTKETDLRRVMEINFFAPYFFTQYAVRLMNKNGGSIVNISSVVGSNGHSGQSAYGASKAAMDALTKTLSQEFGGRNIRVNSIAPGMTETDMIRALSDITRANADREVEELVPLKRFGTPEEIANAALYLASDLSTFVTGQVLRVDGGLI
jgi:3-oxoacyl-[acyl-carrier protein] reductase